MKKLNQDSYYGSEYSAESIEEQNKRYAEDFLLNLLGLIHAEFSSSENQDELSIDKHFGMPMLNFNEDGIWVNCEFETINNYKNFLHIIVRIDVGNKIRFKKSGTANVINFSNESDVFKEILELFELCEYQALEYQKKLTNKLKPTNLNYKEIKIIYNNSNSEIVEVKNSPLETKEDFKQITKIIFANDEENLIKQIEWSDKNFQNMSIIYKI